MARPLKQGLDYFPLDVNFLKDIKVRKIKRACGPATVEVLLCLLGNIYRDTGYYFGWDEDTMFLVADEVGAKEGLVEEIVNKAVQVGFFDKDKFEKYKILTSKGIQNRYREAAKKRKEIVISDIYLVNDEFTEKKPSNNSDNEHNNSVNSHDNQQSKVNKSKVNKSKKNKTVKAPDMSVQFSEYLKIFSDFTKGVKSQPRSNAQIAFVDLHELQREQAIVGAKNYVKWYKKTGRDIYSSVNAAKFLLDLIFTEYQEIPEVREQVQTNSSKNGKSVPDWATPYKEPEYSEEEIADVFKD
ncbi:phage replisome organizer protein [Lactococcus garvieae]|uniref:DnaD domain protein n=1 Tax=Lactococcus garvieae DCC43 TaxID=1231377 RepID=K2PKF4_9LACT|nr:phage replisome organiser protein [Lactococcus garvieae]EKF50674.1 DnaD domain protein [Lactococcus garvieae DCC43]